MAEIKPDDWVEWYNHPVTLELRRYIAGEIDVNTWDLVQNAGKDPHQDARRSGASMALGNLLNWKPDGLRDKEAAEELDD